MNLPTPRWIDRNVGIPACYALTAIVKLLEVCGLRGRAARPERVLFIELSEMGSTILASAAIQRLLDRYGDHEHCFVIFKRNAASLRLLGLFKPDQIFTIRDDSVWSLIVDVFHFVKFCRERRVDTVIDLELFSRVSSLLALLSGASNRVGFHNYRGEGLYRGEHLTHRVHYNPYSHMAQNFMALVESLSEDPRAIPLVKRDIPLPATTCRVPLQAAEYDYIRAELARCIERPKDTSLVVLLNHHAGHLLPIRSWPVDRFAALAKRLLDWDSRIVVVLVGVREAEDSARAIVAAVGSRALQ